MTDLILFDDIDEPGLATIDVYRRRGGYEMVRRALDMTPDEVVHELDAVGPARARRRRLLDGQEGLVHAARDDGQVPRLQRRRVRAGHLQGPRAHAEEPAHAHRGHDHRAYAVGANRAFIYIRGEYELQADMLEAAVEEARAAGLPRRAHPRLRPLADPVGAPRRGRLHLRRGDGAAGLARGQARQPAPQAAVPGQPGPVPGPDADQQRRDARHGAAHHAHGRRGVRQDRDAELDRHEARLRVGQRPAARQLRDRAGDPLARAHLRAGRRAAGRPRGEAVVPRRLERAGAHGRRPRPPLRLRHDGQGRLDARLGRDHRRRRLATPSSTSR